MLCPHVGSGCVTPTPDTILSGEYQPLTRPLFIYVNKESLARPEVREFVEFYMERGEELTREVGYVPVAASAYMENLRMIAESN